MFSRIIVPLDGSAESAVALPLARTVAQSTGAAITLLRVVPSTDQVDGTSAALERIAHELASADLQVEPVVRVGEPTDEILKQVRARTADLIVMRTHGRAGLGRAVLGSVAERVLSESNVPVALLRPGGRRVTHVRRLLVPVDGSPGGAAALGTAVGLARSVGAALKLLEVVVPISSYLYAWDIGGGGPYMDPGWDDEAVVGARAYVDGLVTRVRGSGLRADGEARVGSSVSGTIVEAAEDIGADLIVMSTQALTGPARAVLGSVADAVVRAAHCPVLLVHRGDGKTTQATPSRTAINALRRVGRPA